MPESIKRVTVMATVIIAALVLTAPAILITGAYAAKERTIYFRQNGAIVNAQISGVTPEGEFITTVLNAVGGTVVEGNLKTKDTFIFVCQTRGVEQDGVIVIVSELCGELVTTDKSVFEIDNQLQSATLSAVVPVCTFEDFVDGCDQVVDTFNIQAEFIGTGEIVEGEQKGKFKSGNIVEKFSFNGEFRSATVSGTINGEDLGQTDFADMGIVKNFQAIITKE
jgi:hypothetical protein